MVDRGPAQSATGRTVRLRAVLGSGEAGSLVRRWAILDTRAISYMGMPASDPKGARGCGSNTGLAAMETVWMALSGRLGGAAVSGVRRGERLRERMDDGGRAADGEDT